MPEWHEPDVWTPMGLWDPVSHRESPGERLICMPMHEALQSARHIDELHQALMDDRDKFSFFPARRDDRPADVADLPLHEQHARPRRRSGAS
jgi:hypothetical protein